MNDNKHASELIRAMAQRYAGCNSYSDSGKQQHSGVTNCGVNFSTQFVRPEKFRFEWIRSDEFDREQGLLRCDGVNAYSRDIFEDRVIKERSLVSAISAATGISSGTAFEISSLLISIAWKRNLAQLHDLRFMGKELVEDQVCYHLTGGMDKADDTELWLLEKDCSIKKTLHRTVLTAENAEKAAKSVERVMSDLSSLPPELREMVKNFNVDDMRTSLAYLRKTGGTESVSEVIYHGVKFDIPISDEVFEDDAWSLKQ